VSALLACMRSSPHSLQGPLGVSLVSIVQERGKRYAQWEDGKQPNDPTPGIGSAKRLGQAVEAVGIHAGSQH
jgi:hypothetical protein